MCTSILYSPKDHYFGRNLDYEIAYGQKVVIHQKIMNSSLPIYQLKNHIMQ